MVRAGDMRHKVRIESRSVTIDAAGERTGDWVVVCTRRAAIQRAPGAEVFAAAQRQGRVPTVFRLRYPVDLSTAISPGMRLVHGTRVYDIVSAVDLAGLREELVITAEERLGDAP